MRSSEIKRATKETEIGLRLLIEGKGEARIETGIPFLSHLLNLLTYNSLFDIEIMAKGDLSHHITEDIGIALGSGLAEALADKKGIQRYGSALLPMDEALAMIAIDISGRPNLVITGNPKALPFLGKSLLSPINLSGIVDGFDISLIPEFLKAFVDNAKLTLHITLFYGKDTHHLIEAIFKGMGRALRSACELDERSLGIPSTKGVL
ncbi:MAG: imidazoleglycerol-phosphate dehydratase HisB [bacterium]|nr:imidazoleglycerol-phosphate dehydratase HisB [bacterium]